MRKTRIKELIAAFVVGKAMLDHIAPRERAKLWLAALLGLFRSESLRRLPLWFANHPSALRFLTHYQEPPQPWYQRRFSEYRLAVSILAPVVLITGTLLTVIFYRRRRRRAMTMQENKAIFRRYVEEVGNKGNLELVDEIFDRYLSHQSDGRTEERGPEDVKRFIGEFHRAFPDFRTVVEDQIAEGDKVVTRWRASGTHQGEFRGIAPTGNKITVTGIGIFRFSEEGKVVESWDSMDQLGMMQQLGVIPSPE